MSTNGASTEMTAASPRSTLYEAMMAQAQSKTKKITIFGQEVEIRQPSVEAFRAVRHSLVTDETNPDEVEALEKDPDRMLWAMIAEFTFVPGSDELVFPNPEAVKNLPFGNDASRLIEAVGEIASLASQVDEQTKNSSATSSDLPS